MRGRYSRSVEVTFSLERIGPDRYAVWVHAHPHIAEHLGMIACVSDVSIRGTPMHRRWDWEGRPEPVEALGATLGTVLWATIDDGVRKLSKEDE